jgi:hypothetical protein
VVRFGPNNGSRRFAFFAKQVHFGRCRHPFEHSIISHPPDGHRTGWRKAVLTPHDLWWLVKENQIITPFFWTGRISVRLRLNYYCNPCNRLQFLPNRMAMASILKLVLLVFSFLSTCDCLVMCATCGRRIAEMSVGAHPASARMYNSICRSSPNDESVDTAPDKVVLSSEDKTTELLIAMIQIYKDQISPLIGPNCRFVPTCSSYAIGSLKKYGPVKGLLLTAWRILRCNPLGGKGYDPPQWPPCNFFAGSS